MAEAAIFHLLDTFAPFIQDEITLLSGVREEIEHIRDEFERMNAFLGVVDANGEHHPGLKVCVRQVREASYEAGDVLERYMLQLNHHNSDGVYGFLRRAAYFVLTFKVRHQIAIKVRRIKSRLGDISQGYERYRYLLGTIEQGSGSHTVHINNSWYDGRGDALLLEDHEIVGIKGPQSEIIKLLGNKDSRLQVISVVGMGGMGKTTLVKKVFDNIETRKNFESHAWIAVSETYKVDELLKDIIRQLFEEASKEVPKEVQRMDSNHLKITINDFLKQKRYLLVLDDVWHTHAWQALRYAFPDGNRGSRVLLTTRIASIASSACKEHRGKVYNLLPLPEEKAWTLFCLKAFQGQLCPSHLEGISRDILKKCEGLPLAIVAIGGLLSTKDQGSIDEWDRVYRTLGTELEGNGKLQSLQNILLLSYYDLPYYLKVCFLYLSIYPENYLIDHWRLVRLLVAEGFVEPKQGMTIEEVAGNYLMELENRSLILVEKLSVNGTVKAYHIHDMWRETIVPKSMEQNLVIIAGARQENRPNKIRRLSIHDGFQNWQEIKHLTDHLRSLLIFGSIDENAAFLMIASLKDRAKLLKVLDIRGLPLTTFPEKAMKLPHLKYLSLRGTRITEIPKSIGNLLMLETLDLKDTLVTELPDEIIKLKNLRHLLVYRYLHEPFYLPYNDHFGFKAVKGMGNFSCLQKLCSVELNQGLSDGSIVNEIAQLTQLRRINILKVKTEDGIELCSSLEKLRNLRSLSIGATNADEIISLESLSSPPQFLRTLVIKGRLEKFPHWMSSLHNVVKLYLRYSKLEEDPLEPLQSLPNLAELLLERAYDGGMLIFKAGGFPRLKKLVLDSLNGLTQITVVEGAMPQLEKLHIFGCALLDEFPSGIESLTCLRDLQLIDMSYTLISKLNRDVPNGDYHKITHISKVLVGGFTDGRWRRHHI